MQLAATLPLGLPARALAQDPASVGSITSIAPRIAMQGKLATKTEILAGQGQAPMLTLGSMEALKGAISMYDEIVAGGGWPVLPPGRYDSTAKPAALTLLRQRLVREGYLDFDTLTSPQAGRMDAGMIAAIRSFQYNHGALPTGKVDERTRQEMNISAEARLYTLQENQPRVMEHMRDLGPRYIAVNIPGAQLETVELGQLYSRHNVVVGKLDRPTPSLKSRVSDILFNPTWNSPASIVQKDIIPKMMEDPGYLQKMNIHVLDGVNGPEIDPASVNWQLTPPDRFVFVQDPGDHNALGTVKINFPNKFMVYMHDTPHRELFATNDRWESSGCVRVDKVKHLITWVMNGQDGYDETNFDPIIATRQPQQVKIHNAPDVRFMYLTAWATEDGRVNFRPDVYKLEGKGFILGQPEPLLAG
ncbi:MAG: L,D-transpeptidase family protein [Alphaproteobacteria bacterium]|nr:L,D-transpeptidase family protein [Alphaproteobacteria bacterium]